MTFVEGDLLAPIRDRAPFLLIGSNPPYIPTAELAGLQAEVRREPRAALDGGADGLDLVRRLIADAAPLLAHSGALVIELGAGQASRVLDLLSEDRRYADARAVKDLAGIERVVSTRRAAP